MVLVSLAASQRTCEGDCEGGYVLSIGSDECDSDGSNKGGTRGTNKGISDMHVDDMAQRDWRSKRSQSIARSERRWPW